MSQAMTHGDLPIEPPHSLTRKRVILVFDPPLPDDELIARASQAARERGLTPTGEFSVADHSYVTGGSAQVVHVAIQPVEVKPADRALGAVNGDWIRSISRRPTRRRYAGRL